MHINSELDELSGLSEPYPGIDGSNLEDNTVTEALGALQVSSESPIHSYPNSIKDAGHRMNTAMCMPPVTSSHRYRF